MADLARLRRLTPSRKRSFLDRRDERQRADPANGRGDVERHRGIRPAKAIRRRRGRSDRQTATQVVQPNDTPTKRRRREIDYQRLSCRLAQLAKPADDERPDEQAESS